MSKRTLLLALGAALVAAAIAIVIASTSDDANVTQDATQVAPEAARAQPSPPSLPDQQRTGGAPRPVPEAVRPPTATAPQVETDATRAAREEGEAACVRRDQAAAQAAYNRASIGGRLAIDVACKQQKIDLAPPPRSPSRRLPGQ